MDWIAERLPAHGAIFLTHGEDEGRKAMQKALAEKGLNGEKVRAPQLDDSFELRATGIAGVTHTPQPRIDPEQFRADWTSEYAQFSIEFGHLLSAQPSDKERLELIKKLQAVISKQ